MRYKLEALASLLHRRVLRWLHLHWPVALDPTDGWTFWIDADYRKYARVETRAGRKHW